MIPAGVEPRVFKACKDSVPGMAKAVGAARLYQASETSDWDLQAMGLLFLIQDPDTSAPIMHLVDLKTNGVIWSHEMYPGVNLNKLNGYFLAFEGDPDCMWGLSFADGCDAGGFHTQAVRSISELNRGKKSRPARGAKRGGAAAAAAGGRKKGGIFSRLFGRAKNDRPNVSISGPRGFKHSMHIGVEPGKGFVTENLPDEWKKIFEEAGISKEDYEDPEKAQNLMSALSLFKEKTEKGKKRKRRRRRRKRPTSALPDTPPGGALNDDPGDLMAPPPDPTAMRAEKEAAKAQRVADRAAERAAAPPPTECELDTQSLSTGERVDLMHMLKSSLAGRLEAMRGEVDAMDDGDDDWDDVEEDTW